MKTLSDLFRKKSKISEQDEHKVQSDNEQIKKDYVQKTYTFSSIFATEEQMERAMKIIHKSENRTVAGEKDNYEDDLEI